MSDSQARNAVVLAVLFVVAFAFTAQFSTVYTEPYVIWTVFDEINGFEEEVSVGDSVGINSRVTPSEKPRGEVVVEFDVNLSQGDKSVLSDFTRRIPRSKYQDSRKHPDLDVRVPESFRNGTATYTVSATAYDKLSRDEVLPLPVRQVRGDGDNVYSADFMVVNSSAEPDGGGVDRPGLFDGLVSWFSWVLGGGWL